MTAVLGTGVEHLVRDRHDAAPLSMPERCGVVAIPNEVFYARPEHGRHLVRFACCKQLSVLDEAARRLATLATA